MPAMFLAQVCSLLLENPVSNNTQLVMVAVQVVILAAVLDVAKQENAVVHPLYIAPKQEANAAAL